MSLLINNGIVNDEPTDILIEGNCIESIGNIKHSKRDSAETVMDATDKLVLPTFHNGHTHAAMTLFRGYGDDLPLQTWLEEKIWPLEDQLTDEHVYWATRLACLEMIQSGTTFFNDMYWEFDAIVRAVKDSGLRARVSGVFIDQFDDELAQQQRDANRRLMDRRDDLPDRVEFALGPHSIYTVSKDSLKWIADFSRDHDLPVHIHLAETEREFEESCENHDMTPVQYLHELDFLHENVVVAHGVWLEDRDVEILSETGTNVVYNPISNLKLTSGDNFRYDDLVSADIPVCLGTDGVASNNNLNLFEEIKMASILQKNRQEDPTVLPAEDAFQLATKDASGIFDLNSGEIKENRLADLMLIDLNRPELSLGNLHDTKSHLSYTTGPNAIDTVICDGEILMHDGELKDDQTDVILERHHDLAEDLCYKE